MRPGLVPDAVSRVRCGPGPIGLLAASAGGGRRATPEMIYLKASTEDLDK